jgi:hypothetical protein
MTNPKDSFLEAAPDLLNAHIEYFERSVESYESHASAVAWEVAVVSPGFLGLIWNFPNLGKHTMLSADTFRTAFLLSALLFLGSIIASIVLYGFLTAHRAASRDMAQKLQLAKLVIAFRKATQPIPPRLKKAMDEIQALSSEPRSPIPWHVAALGHGTVYLTVAGYVVLGFILCMIRL